MSVTKIGLIAIPISSGIVCGLTISNKLIYEIVKPKYNKYKKHYERDQQTDKSFVKLYKKSLEDNLIDKNEYESQCNFFTNYVDETKTESFL